MKKDIKNSEQYPTFNIGNMDISFVHEMVSGGIYDDGSGREIYFNDNNDYSNVEIKEEEIKNFIKKFNLKVNI